MIQEDIKDSFNQFAILFSDRGTALRLNIKIWKVDVVISEQDIYHEPVSTIKRLMAKMPFESELEKMLENRRSDHAIANEDKQSKHARTGSLNAKSENISICERTAKSEEQSSKLCRRK